MKKQVCQDDLTAKNIQAIYDREQEEISKSSFPHRVAHKVANFTGTVLFLTINLLVMIIWILINLLTPWKFDAFPFAILSMVVGIESMVLALFVLISQNKMSALAERRRTLDLHVNLLNEAESTALIHVVIQMARKMGIPEEQLEQLKEMSEDTDPEKVLNKIAEVEDK